MTAWKQFYRFEIPYETVADSTPDCKIEYEDVLEALKNFAAEAAPIRTIKEKWLYPLMHLDDEVGLREAAGIDPSEDLDDALANSLETVPFERKATLKLVLSYLYAQALELLDSDCQSCVEIMENVLYNEGKPISQWHLSDMQKVLFVCEFYESGRVDLADEATTDLFMDCLNHCYDRNMYMALKVMAMLMIYDNTLVTRDYVRAEELLRILVDEIEDVDAALELGYLYYYNRIPNREDDAYRLLSMAAASEIPEAAILQGACLAYGKGVPRSQNGGFNLVRNAYAHAKHAFINGDNSEPYAMAALYLGTLVKEGVGCLKDPMLAYSYFLEANRAMEERMRFTYNPMDTELREKIITEMESLEAQLYGMVHDDRLEFASPLILERVLAGSDGLEMELVKVTNRNALLKLRRTEKGRKILMTVENCSYCELVDEVIIGVSSPTMFPEYDKISFYSLSYRKENDGGIMLEDRDGLPVAILTGEKFIFRADQVQQDDEQFALVLKDDMTLGEYHADDQSLKRGDRVVVKEKDAALEGAIVHTYRMPGRHAEPIGEVMYKMTNRYLA